MGLQETKIESLPFVTAELNYLAPTQGKPRTYAYDPPPGVTDALRAASWGDDYQLLFAAPEGSVPPAPATRIGRVVAVGAAPLLLHGEPAQAPLGYQHR